MCYYYHSHELSKVNKEKYNIINFEDLPPDGPVVQTYLYRGQEKSRFALSRICGTVLDKNKNKNTVDLLTPTGVVTLKFYKGAFNFYDRQLSKDNEDGTKTVIEKSWFSRGNKLLITGYRRDTQFVPRKYSDSLYKHSVQLIKSIDDNGELVLTSDRADKEREENEF